MVTFTPVPGQVPELPEEVVKQLSRDQALAYKWAHAIQTGVVPDSLAGQTIGPIFHARWNTLSVRSLAKYSRVRKPTKKFRKIIHFILNMYLPVWFRVKCHPHIQDGSRHFYYMVELSKDLERDARDVIDKVLDDNSHFAHPESIVISLLADPREELRRKGVLHILAARLEENIIYYIFIYPVFFVSRKEYNPDNLPRQFLPPSVNFKVQIEF